MIGEEFQASLTPFLPKDECNPSLTQISPFGSQNARINCSPGFIRMDSELNVILLYWRSQLLFMALADLA